MWVVDVGEIEAVRICTGVRPPHVSPRRDVGKDRGVYVAVGECGLRKQSAVASSSCAESSHAGEGTPISMDFVESIPHRTYSSSRSSKPSVPVESVLGVGL